MIHYSIVVQEGGFSYSYTPSFLEHHVNFEAQSMFRETFHITDKAVNPHNSINLFHNYITSKTFPCLLLHSKLPFFQK